MTAFHSTPMHDPGLKEVQRPARVCVCKGASVLPCLLSCCCYLASKTARRSAISAAGIGLLRTLIFDIALYFRQLGSHPYAAASAGPPEARKANSRQHRLLSPSA